MTSKLVWAGVILLILARVFVFQPVEVSGKSMEPNYHTYDRLIVEQFSFHFTKNYKRGQVIVVYANPHDIDNDNVFSRFSKVFYIKRVIGLPGEYIQTKGSKTCIYNNDYPEGAIISENYLSDSVKAGLDQDSRHDYAKKRIPEGSYFIMGDNRLDSQDSRVFGPVQEKALLGKEWVRFWPVNEADAFELPTYTFTSPCNF
ncbi:MAG: signal peptidase I [Patescibacteria group bacterium]